MRIEHRVAIYNRYAFSHLRTVGPSGLLRISFADFLARWARLFERMALWAGRQNGKMIVNRYRKTIHISCNLEIRPKASDMRIPLLIFFAMLIFTAPLTTIAEDADLEFFEKKIRPVLVTHCYECHSADAKKLGGELLLDSRDGVKKGGETGSALDGLNPDKSLLIKAVRYTDDALKMPPKGKLPDSVIADLETWVRNGAADPRDQPISRKVTASWKEFMQERSDWWSLRPVVRPDVPRTDVAALASSPVDRFIFAKLAESGLVPAGPTDPTTFVRRLSLVLTGLPPTIEQVDRFVAECGTGISTNATNPLPGDVVERLVDSLLQSPQFGEQWARHWMDCVRFSETHGNEWNYEVHHAWRYRDYLIRAFNDDVPYDQFIREHLAGDLLPRPRWNEKDQFNESVIGTGFYRFGEVNHDDCISLRSLGYDLADNQIDTLTKAFQATTVACARCHKHKLDPISSEDYYGLLAVLRSSRNVSHCFDAPTVNADKKQRLRELKSLIRRELAPMWESEYSHFADYMFAASAVRAKRPAPEEMTKKLDPRRLEKWVATLAAEKQPFDEPFEIWRRLVAVETPPAADAPVDETKTPLTFEVVLKSLTEQFAKESQERSDFNSKQFVTYADFRNDEPHGWSVGGQSMSEPASRNGDFIVQPEGDTVLQSILPAGRYTHSLSSKLNGTLRSPVLPVGKKYISFQVLGQRSSAVRLVSNNCQLNYANYRALTSPELTWVTFSPPDDRESLRTYAELMTMFDNPKFPDQLSALGGDGGNYKLPWDKASENPRSYFGVTRVVLHDSPEMPKPDVSHLRMLFESGDSSDNKNSQTQGTALDQITHRYAVRILAAITAFRDDKATEDDVRWLDVMLRRELISNKVTQIPDGSEPQSRRCDSLIQEYRKIEAELSLPRVAVGFGDGGQGIAQPVFTRGDCTRPGEAVPRRYLEVLSKSVEPFTSQGSGRMELADQIASPNNPLTARVMVNRIWHHLFGTGLVRTVDDFGHVGEVPSHPELLDYLASDFIERGWSVKQLIRSLVLTRTFQMSNQTSLQSRDVDPQNRCLQHYPARRMEAESVRDTILAASGSLDRTLYGPSIQPFREKEYADRRLFPGPLDGNGRRSIYIKNNLMEGPKFLGTFNFPGGKVVQGRRDVTNVPAQALALLNDPFVLQQAAVWSQKLLKKTGDSISTRLETMFRSSLGRSPDAEELSRFEQTVRQLADHYQVPADNVMSNAEVWKDIAHSIFNLNEMIYIP